MKAIYLHVFPFDLVITTYFQLIYIIPSKLLYEHVYLRAIALNVTLSELILNVYEIGIKILVTFTYGSIRLSNVNMTSKE